MSSIEIVQSEKKLHPEIEKFIKWCYNEINNNEMVALGPYRFVAESKIHKQNLVTPAKWLSLMARDMSKKSGEGITGVDVAKDFNEIIDSNEIEPFITRSAKSIAESVANELISNPEQFKQKYKINKKTENE